MISTLQYFWNRNQQAGQTLTADLGVDIFASQPREAMNHPAWILSHLNAYYPAILGVIRGETFADPKEAEFGMKSRPLPDPSIYASPESLREAFARGHREVDEALQAEGESALQRPVTLARWQDAMPDTAAVLMNLLVWHETYHLGQLSAWRRAMGLPAAEFLPLPPRP